MGKHTIKKQANSIYSAKIKNRIKGAECPRAFQLSNEQYRTMSKQTDRHQESQAANSRDQIESKKVAHTRLPSVGFWSWSRFLAVSLQAAWDINPAVGCNYLPPGLQLPSQPLTGLLPILLLVNRGTMGVNSLPKTINSQRRGCDLNPGPSALESIMLTTRLPSHPKREVNTQY